MADMVANAVTFSTGHQGNTIVLAGERVRIQILNSDGSQKTLLLDDSVPTGKQAKVSINLSATLENA